ncbi:sugar ABC transporter ATP-binding protein [Actinomadura sp. K4S16]|uniref:sugar ABC transporter ATP-binding protein n=1 Tax=Actinomadura sp. K4S16 TaxID=1316147 RepID=UPI0011ECDF8C|nr:sugar ABC transporter ATP-binding protein [Actinomadura sp. K4S16]
MTEPTPPAEARPKDPDDPAAAPPVLVAEDITKSYGGVQALRGVTFRARTGAVNVLVGENGAGKSTLMKILSGAEQPTGGRILLDGEAVEFPTPRAALEHGIGIIHQELSLFPNLSITDNIFAGRELHNRAHLTGVAEQRRQAKAALKRLRQDIDPDTQVGDLPIGTQQLVEIARVLSQDVRILIMDEPTSALSNAEVDVLFEVMDDLRAQNVTVIYISHKLEEFRRIGDHVTVLREGALVAEAPMSRTDTGWIVQQMVGRSQDSLFTRSAGQTGDVLLDVEHLTVPGKPAPPVDDVGFHVRAGEIVGIYGLMGAGRTELMEALIGLRHHTGTISVAGRRADDRRVPGRLALGLALVPEDRQRDGLVQALSVRANLLLSTLRTLTRYRLLSPVRERRAAAGQVADLQIKVPGVDAQVTQLSGGNQQKVVLGRALRTGPKVLLLDEPTRGIDIGAKTEIFRVMSDLADQGLGVLFVSSELAEVMGMSDRILVMARGRITADLPRAEATEERLVNASASTTVMKVSP